MNKQTSSLSTIPGGHAPNWIIVPAIRLVKCAGEGIYFSGLVHRAFGVLGQADRLLALAAETIPREILEATEFRTFAADTVDLSRVARESLAGGLWQIHSTGIVSLWAAVEVAVEDTVTLFLMNNADALNVLDRAGFRVPSKFKNQVISENLARDLYRRMEGWARDGGTSAGAALCKVLAAIGLSLQIDSATLADIDELNYVRNCLLHRGGVVDERAASQAPKLGLPMGHSLDIDEHMYKRYFDCVATLSKAMVSAALVFGRVK